MAENSKIEWTDHTVNLWWGCAKVHTGCKNCYAEYLSDVRYKKNLWGEKQPRQRIISAFNDLDKYQKQAERENKILKIFCGSMMDIFEDAKLLINPTQEFQTTSDLRLRLFNRISKGEYNNLIFLFLTKRPENIAKNVPQTWISNAPKNVWFGTSISNQETANIYIKNLVRYKGNNLFLSIEPQIEDILDIDLTYIGWVIQGGESGHNKREFQLQWAYNMKRKCKEQNIPYFFKQIDKIQAIPADLQIREFPLMQVGSACL
jgi:protein gp37